MAEENADRMEALFHQAADLPPQERQAFLDRECANDPELRVGLERLLADDDRLSGDLDTPFLESPLIRASADAAAGATPAAGSPPLPSQLGHYRLIRLLGQGGMGAVYEAEQDSPRRTVALKVVRPGLASPSLLKRFLHESQILGRLHHPGIAQVYESGLADDGQPFFAMEFIRGLPLDEFARLHAQTLQPRVELLARVCDAVQHAHDQGVIHRDLKPSNILVEEGGQPKVLDFGVARATDAGLLSEAALTQTGQLLGTPNYMSPEQVLGDPAGIDRRADVYALGVILFELAAHRLPFRLENRPLAETARLILEEDPPRLGSIDPELRGDVETIVAKALEKDRARRYASSADLAADLRRWLAHEPILARPPSALYHLRKFARRHRGLVGGVVAAGVALILGFVGMTILAIAEAQQRDQAEQNALAADAEKKVAQFQAYRASVAAASAALENHDVADAARHLDSAPKDLRGWEWQHLQSRLDDSTTLVPLPPSDNRFVLAEGGILIDSPNQLRVGVFTNTGIRLTDLESDKEQFLPIDPNHRRQVDVAQTRRGLLAAAWFGDNAFDVLDDAGQFVCRVAGPEIKGPFEVVFSPDGTRLACNAGNRAKPWHILVFDALSGKQTAVWNYDSPIWLLRFSPDSARLASCSEDRTARVWDAATGALLATCQGHESKVLGVAFSPDGSRLVTASADGTVGQWDSRSGAEVESPYDRHAGEVISAVYSPDGQRIASAGSDRTVRVWQARGRKDVAVLHGHTGGVGQVAFTRDGSRVASISRASSWVGVADDTVRVWDADPQSTLPVLRGHTSYVYPVSFSPDGRWIASGGWDNKVRLWDAVTGEQSAILSHELSVLSLAFGPDGTWLITGCDADDRLRIWDVVTGRVRKEISTDGGDILSLALSSDGTRVAANAHDQLSDKHSLNVYDIASAKLLFSTEGMALAYSPDGRWLAIRAADEKTLLLLDARTHEMIAHFSGHRQTVLKAAFSHDGRVLATCSSDHTVRLWQIDSGACHVLTGHTDEVFAVAFHPDGARLATASRDGAVWLWDMARREDVVRLPGHKGYIWSLAFSPDGATLVTGSGDSTVRLWDTGPLKTRYRARHEEQQARPEAERLLERLLREKGTVEKVAERLRIERIGSPALDRAFRKALYRQQGVAPE